MTRCGNSSGRQGCCNGGDPHAAGQARRGGRLGPASTEVVARIREKVLRLITAPAPGTPGDIWRAYVPLALPPIICATCAWPPSPINLQQQTLSLKLSWYIHGVGLVNVLECW